MACARCGEPCLGPICEMCKPFKSNPARALTFIRQDSFTLLGHQDPSRDMVGQQNSNIYARMRMLVQLLEEMTKDMRNLQPMSPSLLKVSTQCKKVAADIEEEMIRRKGM